MFSKEDLRDYRMRENLRLIDVARYCSIPKNSIGKIERGELKLTEKNHAEIVKGINSCIQARARGEFEADIEKEKEREKQKKAEEKK